jgi:hypothetical protein
LACTAQSQYLYRFDGVLSLTSIDNLLPSGNLFIVITTRNVLVTPRLGCDEGTLGDQQGSRLRRSLGVIFGSQICNAWLVVFSEDGWLLTGVYMLIIGPVSGQGAKYDTVLKRDISDLNRGEECR